MANRIRTDTGDNADTLKINVPHKLLSSSRSRSLDINDDVIVALSDAYENRRARQVGEWERLYGENVYRARFE